MQETAKIIELIKTEYNIIPVIGLELEFYLKDSAKFSDLIAQYDIIKESGEHQYELRTKPSTEIIHSLSELNDFKTLLLSQNADFSAKPFHDQPGSALHMHLNFLDPKGDNIFEKSNSNEEAQELLFSVAGLLATMEAAMHFFAPCSEDYQRYMDSIQTPSTISWGNNNRTVAIRIPPPESGPRRIEHRVASANADPFAVCSAILAGTLYGLRKKQPPPGKIYGNAYLDQYGLQPLPRTMPNIVRSNLASDLLKL